jgi:chromosomal replication initiation ATPase DnaA
MSHLNTAPSVLAALRAHNLLPLLEHICEQRGVVIGDVCGRARTRSVARARQELWWSIRHHPQRSYSLLEIARLFRRDHTTVSHGVAAHARRQTP